jgi:hypothetical protein
MLNFFINFKIFEDSVILQSVFKSARNRLETESDVDSDSDNDDYGDEDDGNFYSLIEK